jgi:hypothetical protein
MIRNGLSLVLFLPLVFVSALAPFSTTAAPPYAAGERLVYDVSWYGVSAGSSVMEVKNETFQDRPVYHITSKTQSNSVIGLFYPINDFVESFLDRESLTPYRMRSRLHEGSYQADREILFDRESHVATLVDYRKKGKTESSPIPPLTQDPISVVYYYRTLPMEVGQVTEIDVFDGHKNSRLIIDVIGKEKISTPVGAFDTYKTTARMKFKGFFVHKGDLTIWFSDDEKRTPVLMESKIKIGRIVATLVKME